MTRYKLIYGGEYPLHSKCYYKRFVDSLAVSLTIMTLRIRMLTSDTKPHQPFYGGNSKTKTLSLWNSKPENKTMLSKSTLKIPYRHK